MSKSLACDTLRSLFPEFDILPNDDPDYARILLGMGNYIEVQIVDGTYKVTLGQPANLDEAKLREFVNSVDRGYRQNEIS